MFRFSLPRAILAAILAINLIGALVSAPTVLRLTAHAGPAQLADSNVPPVPVGH